MIKKYEKLLIPVISILLGLLVGILVLLLSGRSVMGLFRGLLQGATGISSGSNLNLRYPGEFLVTSMPLILTGLAIGFAYRCGMFNIGAEGQVVMGSLFSVCFSILCPLPAPVGPIVALFIGGIGGALWAFIPGILKVKFNISEVVTGIMLNYTALCSTNYFISDLPGSSEARTVDIPESMSLSSDFLSSITNNSRLHWGIIMVILMIVLYWFIIEKTSFGYSLRATGFNKEGARYAGIKADRSVILSIMISGFLAGLAGAILVLGTFNYGRVLASNENYGFDGIAVALVGGCNAIGIAFSGLLFGLLKVAEPIFQINGIPREVGQIVSSSIIFFVALQYGIKYVLDKLSARKKDRASDKGGVA